MSSARAAFSVKEDIAGQTKVKNSVQRNFRIKIVEQFPLLEPHIDELIPKKDPVFLVKCLDRVNIISVNDKFLFFNSFDGPFFPSLYILHKYPDILPKIQVDRGAIKFVLKAADIMCPGVTSPGGQLPSENLPVDSVVAIYAEGKQHAVAVGITKMTTDDMKKINKGVGIINAHFLNDGLWKSPH
ncbi:hypothetical protein BSLG_000065 [Batrachochytrium salamandrivorans]|nr:hypothetical protein BSLG_000065 [Batrachochytrium salamandrivorans]